MNYKKKIINALLKKHNKWNKNSASLTTEQVCPEVVKTGHVCDYNEFLQAAKELQSEGFLLIKERKNDYPKLILTDNIDTIVSYAAKAGFYTINEYVKDCLDILNQFTDTNCPQINIFCNEQINNLNNHKKVSLCLYNEDCNTSDILKETLLGALAVFNQSEDILTRNFSIIVYGDSKKFANNYMRNICKILDATKVEEGVDCYTILNQYHIYQNPTEVKIKGNFTIEFINGDILHGRKDSSLSFGKSFVLNITNIDVDNIISIENLTTYNSYNPQENELVIYLGGFANNVTIEFIKKALKPTTNYYHFGDVDAGGFNILLDLENKISHTVMPYKMSTRELKEYAQFCKTLTSNDINKLNSFKSRDSRFNNVIDFMLENNCKLEQEAIEN